MAFLMRGALIEYGTDLIGPIPNVVIFQFNPESMTRSFRSQRPATGANREQAQAGTPPTESITLKAHFSAADLLKDEKVLAKAFGIGPQLAALEKMVQPSALISGAIGAVIDAVGDLLGGGGGDEAPTQPIPRQSQPKIIFIWGITRVLPVSITSLRIAEVEYDYLLNPIRAEVDLDLDVNAPDPCSDDWLAKGALTYSTAAKEAQAIANLANTAEQIVELIPI
jgi:hypothetical protein